MASFQSDNIQSNFSPLLQPPTRFFRQENIWTFVLRESDWKNSVCDLQWTTVVLVTCADKELWSCTALEQGQQSLVPSAAVPCPQCSSWGLSQCTCGRGSGLGGCVGMLLVRPQPRCSGCCFLTPHCENSPQYLPTPTSSFPPNAAVSGWTWEGTTFLNLLAGYPQQRVSLPFLGGDTCICGAGNACERSPAEKMML